jgi:sucrose phosphorylase
MPGKPQVWYLDLFAGKNNYEAVKLAGESGHKEINRTNLNAEDIIEGLKKKVVQEQLNLLRFRNTCNAFGFESKLTVLESDQSLLKLCWEKDGYEAALEANLVTFDFVIRGTNDIGEQIFTSSSESFDKRE